MELCRYRSMPIADSDSQFHDAEEWLEDTEGIEGVSTGLESTQVATIAPTCHSDSDSDSLFTEIYNEESVSKSGKHINISKRQH